MEKKCQKMKTIMNSTKLNDNFSKLYYNFSEPFMFEELCNFMEFLYKKNIIYEMDNCEEIYWSESENEDSFNEIFQSKNETELTEILENYLEISYNEEELNISCEKSIDVTVVKEDSNKKLVHKLMIENELNLNTSRGSDSLLSITEVKDNSKFDEIYNNYEVVNIDFC